MLLLVKSNIKRVNNLRLRRNAIYRSSFLVVRKIGDKFVLLILPRKFVKNYTIYSPFFSETCSLIPYFYLYCKIPDEQFYNWHSIFGRYRMIYQAKMPVRLGFTVLSYWVPSIVLKCVQTDWVFLLFKNVLCVCTKIFIFLDIFFKFKIVFFKKKNLFFFKLSNFSGLGL